MSNSNANAGELWRPIEELPAYEVSSNGRIRRNGRVKATHVFNHHSDRRPWVRVTLHHEGSTTYRAVHVLVANAFLGERPQGMTLKFKNGDSTDARLDNLEYGPPNADTWIVQPKRGRPRSK